MGADSVAPAGRLRMLLVTPFVPHVRVGHGTATVASHVVEYFGGRHDLSVASFSFSDREHALAQEVARGCAGMHVVPFPASAARQWRTRIGSVLRGVPYLTSLFDVPAMRAELTRLLAARPFDVVQFDTTFMGAYVDLVQDPHTKTALVEIDFTVKPLTRRYERARPSLKRIWYRRELARMRQYEPALCRRFDRVLAVSSDDQAALQRLDPALRVDLFRYGVAPELFDLAAEERPDGCLLFLGAFLHRPNVEAARWLCDAILPIVRRGRPEARLSCVGGNPPEWLAARAGSHGVSVTGWVPDVRVHLARAHIGLVPLRSGGGVKLKTLELMAAGKAIVTTPIGIEGINAIDGEHVLVADTAKAFAGCVVRLLDDAALRRRLGRRARELARRDHSWAQNLGRLEDDYLNLANAPAMPVARAV